MSTGPLDSADRELAVASRHLELGDACGRLCRLDRSCGIGELSFPHDRRNLGVLSCKRLTRRGTLIPEGLATRSLLGLATPEHLIAHASPHTALRRLIDSVVFRRVADAVLRVRARREVARFDRLEAARRQRRILLGLVHAAEATPFGRDHDFRRIRTEADFRRLLPLRTPAELRRAGGPTTVGGKLLRQAHAAAWRTALAFVVGARPMARLLSGRLVFLDGVAVLPALVRPYTLAEPDQPDRRGSVARASGG